MTPQEQQAAIRDLEKLASKATPRPWELGGCSGRMVKPVAPYGGDGFIADVDLLDNSKFIAAIANAADWLLPKLDELTGKLEAAHDPKSVGNIAWLAEQYKLRAETAEGKLAIVEAENVRLKELVAGLRTLACTGDTELLYLLEDSEIEARLAAQGEGSTK